MKAAALLRVGLALAFTAAIASVIDSFSAAPELASKAMGLLPGPLSIMVQWVFPRVVEWLGSWAVAADYAATAAGLYWILGKPANYLATHYFAPYPVILTPLPAGRHSGLTDGGAALLLVGRDHALDRLWGFARAPAPVAWQLVIGLPGSGKSRLADEFGRAIAYLDTPQRLALARHLIALRAWLRVALRQPLRDSDPWDVGWLDSEMSETELAEWRPRRPTLVLIELGAITSAAAERRLQTFCDAKLAEFAGTKRRPVRILLIDQVCAQVVG